MSEPMSDADKVSKGLVEAQTVLMRSDSREAFGEVGQRAIKRRGNIRHNSIKFHPACCLQTDLSSLRTCYDRHAEKLDSNEAHSNHAKQYHSAEERDEWTGEAEFQVWRDRRTV